MNELFLLTAIPFILLSTYLVYKIFRWKEKYKNLSKKYTSIIDNAKELQSPLRNGFYKQTINLSDVKDSLNIEPYDCLVYVKELDKFTNGTSKIELKKVEVIDGFNIKKYEFVKSVVSHRFCSIIKTEDIEWLESEESLKFKRKQKIEMILEKTK